MTGLDHRVQHWVVLHRTGWLTPLFEAAAWLGTWGAVWLAIGLAGAVAARAAGRRSGRWDALAAAVVAVVLAEGAAAVLKVAIQRHRPEAGLAGPAAVVRVPLTYSFPSGHATVAFAGATALALALPRARLRVPLLLLAAAVAYSRVYLGVHWPADVVAGALIGAPLGAMAARLAPRAQAWAAARATRLGRTGRR